ncbi:DUF4097 and DUF4098 domain-containing protein YvlB [Streptacidiphilus sp. MAP12-33]|uniref:DUF4097 family beta strand repeat-containing protein n=1 Tax=Streptacidiphilus sp. MAP12-33 TaxID=3156266 RepID=UPI0035186B8A
MQKFDTTAPVAAVVEIPAGRVRLIATDRTDTVVEVAPADPAKSRDVKTAEQIEVSYSDGVLRVAAAPARHAVIGHAGAVEVTVQLPAGSRVEARSEAAELHSVGRLGDLAFEGAYRHIKIDEVASLRLTAVDGDVEVGRLGGDAEISTSRGAITVAEAVSGTVHLTTQMGDITVGAAPGVSASLDAGTGHGRVGNALRNNGVTELAVHATTHHGDITARSL